jgi:hypothetical protein
VVYGQHIRLMLPHATCNFKGRVYKTNPRMDEEAKENVRRSILEVRQEELFRVNFKILKRKESVCVHRDIIFSTSCKFISLFL